ncbi:hypothetical protein QTP88_019153 [Uroleucon formosanum]
MIHDVRATNYNQRAMITTTCLTALGLDTTLLNFRNFVNCALFIRTIICRLRQLHNYLFFIFFGVLILVLYYNYEQKEVIALPNHLVHDYSLPVVYVDDHIVQEEVVEELEEEEEEEEEEQIVEVGVSETYSLIPGVRNRSRIYVDYLGFKYYKRQIVETACMYLVCKRQKKRNHFCPSTVTVSTNYNDNRIRLGNYHDHEPGVIDLNVPFLREAISERGIDPAVTTSFMRTLYNNEIINHPEAASNYTFIQPQERVKKMRRRRFPGHPLDIGKLVVALNDPRNAIYASTVQNLPSIYVDIVSHIWFFQQALVVNGRSVGVIFANMDAIDKYREELATVTLVGIDGTFKTVPHVPADLKCFLTIQVVFKSVSFPMVYTLLGSMAGEVYAVLFDIVGNILPLNYQHVCFITNYEKALMSAVQQSFSESQLRCCFIHFTQSIVLYCHRKMSSVLDLVRTNPETARVIKMINLSLIFLLNCMRNFLIIYVEYFWLLQVGLGLISVFIEDYRTNNYLESFHKLTVLENQYFVEFDQARRNLKIRDGASRRERENATTVLAGHGWTAGYHNDGYVQGIIGLYPQRGINTLTFENADDNKKIDQVLKAFQDYCKPKKNILHSRYIFYKRSQKENESIEEFLSACRGLIKDCEFNSHEEILRDKIVLDTRDGETRDKLIKQANVTLETAIETLRIAEIQRRELNQMKEIGEKQNEVNAVHSKVRGGKRTYQAQHHHTQNNGNNGHRGQCQTNQRQAKGCSQQEKSQQVFKNNGNFSVNNKKMNDNCNRSDKLCKFCNFMHGKGKCPAYGKKCLKCNKFNHFQSVCKSEIAFVENIDGLSNDNYFCSTVYTMNTFAVSWSETILVENKNINFKLDTGSDVNLLTLNDFNLIKNNCSFKNLVVNKQPINLQAYGGSNINTYFTVDLKVKLREKEYILNFVIVENHCKAILGLHSCIHLGLINKVENVDKILSLNDVLENYYTVFTGLGNFPDEYSIQLKPNAIPVTNVPHRVPINIQDKLKCELDRLVSEKVIREINEPTEWVNRLVIVEKKNGSMRLCLDPRDLNENIIREYCVIPTLSDLSSKLKNARVFSVFDLKDGFWQIKLDLDSSKLCTFGSMFGTFCFNRLPFGINNAAEICQKWNMKVFGGIENVFIYLDDILIFGDTEAQHDYALKQVLDLAMKNNIKFNKNKIQYKVDKVNYLGHIFSYEGMKLDSDRIKSIFEYEVPKTIKYLQRFLGMVNYVGNFIPNLAMLTKPLRDLLKKNNEFVWTSIHNECINKLKTLIASPSVLRNYDNTKDVIVQTDSSKFAIGCVLLQEGRPVCFKSKSLSETEINYGQVDKEFLSVLFACKVFHHYIYGRRVTVQTDHLPLISIMKKNINDIPSKRLQCIKVKLSRYDINLIHVPGKKMFIADALSRACMSSRDNDVDIDVSDVVHSINMSKNIRNEFVQETIKMIY